MEINCLLRLSKLLKNDEYSLKNKNTYRLFQHLVALFVNDTHYVSNRTNEYKEI